MGSSLLWLIEVFVLSNTVCRLKSLGTFGLRALTYEGRLQSSWTHLITPSRNFVEVRWLSLFLNTSLGKRFTSYNAPPTYRKRSADRWLIRNFAWGEAWTEFFVRLGKSGSVKPHRNICHTVQISPHAISGLFQPWKGSSETRNFEVVNGLQHVFEKWVEHCKKCIACQERYFEKETVTAPPQSSDSE
jgi:hypothetical protein